MLKFNSIFKTELSNFLSVRKTELGKSAYAHNCYYLSKFDSYLVEKDLKHKKVSETLITGWTKGLSGKSSSIANEVIVVRIFLKYLNSTGIPAFIPSVPNVSDDYIPYIFSDEEVQKIFKLSDNIILVPYQKYPYIEYEFTMLLRMMYGCGLRVGETLLLKMKDVDLESGILLLKHTKGDKQRLVPMQSSLTEILRSYCLSMGMIGQAEAWIFPGKTLDESLPVKAAHYRFDSILKQLNIVQPGRKKHERGPCLHCIRHVFTFKSFALAESSGRSVDDSIPYLSIYLGHDSLKETEKYLKFSSELFPEAIALFEEYTSQMFPEVNYEK
jgi:integrase/recombinase XerD